MSSSFWTSRGKEVFGRCMSHLSASSPVRVHATAYGHMFARVVADTVRLEERYTAPNPLLGNFIHIPLGVKRPHLVFTFNIRMDGTLHKVHVDKLKLNGCKFKILGIKMFSMCGLVEQLVRKQIREATRNMLPLRAGNSMRDIEEAVRMRLGNEVAIPLVLMEGADLEPAARVVAKTERLIALNARLIHTLVSFTQDMDAVEGHE